MAPDNFIHYIYIHTHIYNAMYCPIYFVITMLIHSLMFVSTLQVVAKGQAELLGRVSSSNKAINLKITEKMVPNFRFLAYYFVENQGRQEIVADSVWVDVMDVCEGKVLSKQITSDSVFQNDNKNYQRECRPGAKM